MPSLRTTGLTLSFSKAPALILFSLNLMILTSNSLQTLTSALALPWAPTPNTQPPTESAGIFLPSCLLSSVNSSPPPTCTCPDHLGSNPGRHLWCFPSLSPTVSLSSSSGMRLSFPKAPLLLPTPPTSYASPVTPAPLTPSPPCS